MNPTNNLPPRDSQGFLLNHRQWTEQIAEQLAREEGIDQLTAGHWEILRLLRQYYEDYDASPAMRALVKYVRLNLNAEKASSIYLLKLFPGSPAKLSAKLAGLPKPANCL